MQKSWRLSERMTSPCEQGKYEIYLLILGLQRNLGHILSNAQIGVYLCSKTITRFLDFSRVPMVTMGISSFPTISFIIPLLYMCYSKATDNVVQRMEGILRCTFIYTHALTNTCRHVSSRDTCRYPCYVLKIAWLFKWKQQLESST